MIQVYPDIQKESVHFVLTLYIFTHGSSHDVLANVLHRIFSSHVGKGELSISRVSTNFQILKKNTAAVLRAAVR
jgi:hypothetical protein